MCLSQQSYSPSSDQPVSTLFSESCLQLSSESCIIVVVAGDVSCLSDAWSVSGQNAFSVNIQEGIETAEIPIQSATPAVWFVN